MKYLVAFLLSINVAHAGDISFEIINRMNIDCSRAQEQYNFLESERSTVSDRLVSNVYSKTLMGSLFAKITDNEKWAYTTRSGTRDAVINLKQRQIREYCWNDIPSGY